MGARLGNGVALRSARTQAAVLGRRLNAAGTPTPPQVALHARRAGLEWRDAPLEAAAVVTLYMFVPLAVLAIGCTNVVNLQLARAGQRAGELSIRLAIGASRAHIIRLLSFDVAVLAALAGAIGWLGARALLTAAQPLFPIQFAMDGRVVVFGLVMVTAVIAVGGGIPGWLAARDVVAPGLRDVQGVGPAHARLRGALVIVQSQRRSRCWPSAVWRCAR